MLTDVHTENKKEPQKRGSTMGAHTELEHRDFNTPRGQAVHYRLGSWGGGVCGVVRWRG